MKTTTWGAKMKGGFVHKHQLRAYEQLTLDQQPRWNISVKGSLVNGISWELVESSKLILDIVKRMTRLLFRASH